MDYGAKAANYVEAFMQTIRWNNAERLYVQLAGQGLGSDTGHSNEARRT
jgi:hypothetical protein